MSLHDLANHIQSQGRGEDKVLVHMTPAEVGGLQALALSHGGSLTVNPETGLPEAGFLSAIMPTLIGAGLTIASGGALSPLMAAGITGAGYGLATGNLGKGLMAGLGAYGGAGLGAGLMGAGADAAMAGVAAPALGADTAANAAALQSYVPQVQAAQAAAAASPWSTAAQGLGSLGTEGGRAAFMSGMSSVPYSGMAGGASLLGALTPEGLRVGGGNQKALIRPYTYERRQNPEAYAPSPTAYSGQPFRSSEQNYFTDKFTPLSPYAAPGPEYAAGGLTALAVGGPIETMSAMNAVGENLGYPQSQMQPDIYSNPAVQRPEAMNMIAPSSDVAVDPYTGEQKLAHGGLSHLGDYSDGGRLLKGPGDGVSDSIPAVIGAKRPARLADGEFVIPARIVSELGNGSTDAGARKLYAMMDRVQHARKKSVGKERVAVDSKAEKALPV